MSKTRVVHVSDNVPGAVYIGRRNNRKGLAESFWANPYRIGHDGTRSEVITEYRQWVVGQLESDVGPAAVMALELLAGKPLACWCRHDGEERTDDNACHGDVLVGLIHELGLETTDDDR